MLSNLGLGPNVIAGILSINRLGVSLLDVKHHTQAALLLIYCIPNPVAGEFELACRYIGIGERIHHRASES